MTLIDWPANGYRSRWFVKLLACHFSKRATFVCWFNSLIRSDNLFKKTKKKKRRHLCSMNITHHVIKRGTSTCYPQPSAQRILQEFFAKFLNNSDRSWDLSKWLQNSFTFFKNSSRVALPSTFWQNSDRRRWRIP